MKRTLVRGVAGGVLLLGSLALPAHAQTQYQSSDDDQTTTCVQSANDTQDNTNTNNQGYTNSGASGVQTNIGAPTTGSFVQVASADISTCTPTNSGNNTQLLQP